MRATKTFGMPLTLALALGGVAHAATYDPAADFSFASNPNGVWSYGYETTLAGSFVAYSQTTTLNGLEYRALDIGNTYTPNVDFNPTAATVTFASTDFRSMQINLHPGPNDEFSVIRFTAPTAGSYALTSAFNMRSYGGSASTDVYVLLNGATQFNGLTNSFNSEANYSGSFALAAGDTLDFVVGSNGNYLGDTTELRASITPVPEPEIYALMLAGLGLVAGIARRRKRS